MLRNWEIFWIGVLTMILSALLELLGLLTPMAHY